MEDTKIGYFLTNEKGQTYGTYIEKDNGELLEPDLMLVEGKNGFKTVVGYAKKIDTYD